VSHTPTDELVAIAWLKTLSAPDLPDKVATTLPAEFTGSFARVRTVGGGMNAVGVRMPVVTVECWARTAGSSKKTPWAEANVLAEDIVSATLGDDGHGHVGRFVQPGPGDYRRAYVGTISAVSRPLRVDEPTAGLARYDVSLTLQWTSPFTG